MERDAQAYDELHQPQIEAGNNFIRELNLLQGDKVLDKGCGTGSVTKYIADIVGSAGQVVGIDPDAARIKIAKEKCKEIGNLQFHVGSSATGFQHDNEPYYDVHISTMAFHWLSNDEKKIYIQKAHQCLKPGGKLAIFCLGKLGECDHSDLDHAFIYYPLTQVGYYKLFQEISLFPNAVVDNVFFFVKCKSLEEFKRWVKASTHHDADNLDPAYLKQQITKDYEVITDDDGSISVKFRAVSITARKI